MTTYPASITPHTDGEESYDEWFVRMVKEGLAEAKDPNAVRYTHEEVMKDWEEQHKELLAMIADK